MVNIDIVKIYEDLKSEINKINRTEEECAFYLQYVPEVMCKNENPAILYSQLEVRAHYGDLDYAISCKKNNAESICDEAYLWELKAPQCPIFQIDRGNKNRLKPSLDLIDAENQLLQKYWEFKEATYFRNDFKLKENPVVYIGGIIISSKEKLIQDGFPNGYEGHYNHAFLSRKHMYQSIHLDIFTWDDILSRLNPENVKYKQIEYPGNPIIQLRKRSDDSKML